MSKILGKLREYIRAGSKEADLPSAPTTTKQADQLNTTPPKPKAVNPVDSPQPNIPETPSAAMSDTPPKASEPPQPPEPLAGPKTLTAEEIAPLQQQPIERPKPKTGALDYTHEMMISGMLSGPQTHLYNLVDNTLKSLTAPMETMTRSLVSIARSPQDRTAVSRGVYEAYGLFSGYLKGIKYLSHRAGQIVPGVRKETMGETLKRVGLNDKLSRTSKIGLTERKFSSQNILGTSEGFLAKILDGVGGVVNAPGSALNTVDIATKAAHYNRYKFGEAADIHARGEVKTFKEAMEKVMADPDVDNRAVKTAEEWAYVGEPDSWVKFILSDTANNLPGLRWVVPFKTAIANIFEHTLERSPLILSSPALMKKLASKDPAIADTARSKLLFGMTALTGMSMLLHDKLTGPLPATEAEGAQGRYEGAGGGKSPYGVFDKNMWERAYGKALTLDIGGMPLETRMMGVYGNFLELIATFNQWNANQSFTPGVMKNDPRGRTEKYLKELGQFVIPIVDVMYDDFWGKNIIEFMDVVALAKEKEDPLKLMNWLSRNLTKAVPVVGSNPMRKYAESKDPYKRRAMVPQHELFMQLPELRKLIPRSYTWDGQGLIVDKLLQSSHANKNLMAIRYGKPDKLDILMADLGVKLTPPGDTISLNKTIGPGRPTSVIKHMTLEEWDHFNQMRYHGLGWPKIKNGLTAREYLKGITSTNTFKDLAPFEQKTWIESAYNTYMSRVRKVMFGETAEDPGGSGRKAIEQLKARALWEKSDSPEMYQSGSEKLINQLKSWGAE